MIVIIGADGFLGNHVVSKLRDIAYRKLISEIEVVSFKETTDEFFRFLPFHYQEVDWAIYCDKRISNVALSVSRYEFVQKLWTMAARYSVPLLYAFYQSLELRESDTHPDRFVKWTGLQYQKPPYWYIFRMDEVYGQQEEIAGERTSRVYDFYRQIVSSGEIFFPSHTLESDVSNSVRDYLYVQDAVRVFYWFMQHCPANGVYDLGSGFERSDLALANAIFRALKLPARIRYSLSFPVFSNVADVPFQPDLKELRRVGYKKPFFTVENGVKSAFRRHC